MDLNDLNIINKTKDIHNINYGKGLEAKRVHNGNQQVEVSHTMESSGSRGRAEMRAEYGYKSKSRYSETGDTKQGAAVVPICLPLCCAAPCVIL